MSQSQLHDIELADEPRAFDDGLEIQRITKLGALRRECLPAQLGLAPAPPHAACRAPVAHLLSRASRHAKRAKATSDTEDGVEWEQLCALKSRAINAASVNAKMVRLQVSNGERRIVVESQHHYHLRTPGDAARHGCVLCTCWLAATHPGPPSSVSHSGLTA